MSCTAVRVATDHNADRRIDFEASAYSLLQPTHYMGVGPKTHDNGVLMELKLEVTHFRPCELLVDVWADHPLSSCG